MSKKCSIKLIAAFSSEARLPRRQQDNIFKMLKEKEKRKMRRIFYPKLSFRNEEVKMFPYKQELKGFITSNEPYKK